MPTKRMSYPVVGLKADSEDQGVIEAIVSVFGNVDLVGDRVVKGAFTKSIADWRSKNGRGRFLPFTDAHDWSREGRIGKVLQMAERDEGLWVKAQLFMGQESARDIYNQIKEGIVGEFSFAYDVIREKVAPDKANELLEVDVLDAAAALHGANPETRLVSVKSDAEDPEHSVTVGNVISANAADDAISYFLAKVGKVGRSISSKNESKLRDAHAAIADVLASLGDSPQGAAGAEGKADEPEVEAKVEDPPSPNADFWAEYHATVGAKDGNHEGS